LLAEVYINLCGGSQDSFFENNQNLENNVFDKADSTYNLELNNPRKFNIKITHPTSQDIELHESFFA
jgi:hypothetical protein